MMRAKTRRTMHYADFIAKHAHMIIIASLTAFMLYVGILAITPLPISYDPAMHAEIVDPIIANQLYPTSWSPLADTGYTYPPLFHWLAFILSRAGAEPVAVVVALGVFLYAVFPILAYLLGSLWGRKTGIMSALVAAVIANWGLVFLAGEYPQLLAMDFSMLFLYFYLKHAFIKSGIFLGLAALSHPFVPVYLSVFVFAHCAIELTGKNAKRKAILTDLVKVCGIGLLVAAIWLPQYAIIVQNAMTHQWRNVRWYYRPGFVGFDELGGMFLNFTSGRFNPLIFALALAGTALFSYRVLYRKHAKADERGILLLFAFTLAFTLFHIPGTQYKFPDMLSLSVPVLVAAGIQAGMKFSKHMTRSQIPWLLSTAAVAAVLLLSAFNVWNSSAFAFAYRQKTIPSDAAMEAAAWLRDFDPVYSIIVKSGEDEIWFSVLSHKYAMDPAVTDLEVLTERTKEQMTDRTKIIENINGGLPVSGITGKYGIKYIVTEGYNTIINEGLLLYDKNGIKIYGF